MGMPEPVSCPMRVAVLSRSLRERDCLADILESNGLQVIAEDSLQESLASMVDKNVADVMLVNLDDSDDDLDVLIDQIEIPILFNDSSSIRKPVNAGGRAWGRRLCEKLIQLSGDEFSLPDEESDVVEAKEQVVEDPTDEFDVSATAYDDLDFDIDLDGDEVFEISVDSQVKEAVVPFKDMPTAEIVALNRGGGLSLPVNRARRIWILGASIGGPQAVKLFISNLPKDLPVCFILAQHIGVGFVNLLAEQLSRVTELKVSAPEDGMVLEKGQIVVAPVEKRMNFSERGIISMEDITQQSIYSPSIDDVITVAAKHYGADANAIIFSGMGNDGTAGCHTIAEKGGMVWAQQSESCVISSMADSVRASGIVSLSGTPEDLAANLTEYLAGEYS